MYYRLRFSKYYGYWHEILYVPQKGVNIAVPGLGVSFGETRLAMWLECENIYTDNNISEMKNLLFNQSFYVAIDHTDQLSQFDKLNDIMDKYWVESKYVRGGSQIYYTYEWLSIENRIDDNKANELEKINNHPDHFSVTSDSYPFIDNVFYIIILTSNPGIKTTFVTDLKLDVTDIISTTIGLYSGISSIFSVIIIYLVWGCGPFNGVAPNAKPGHIEQIQFKNLLLRGWANNLITTWVMIFITL